MSSFLTAGEFRLWPFPFRFDFILKEGKIVADMSTQEMLMEEIKRQPEPVLREVLHYLKYLERQREEEAWSDVLPTREVEQETLDLLDGK